MMKKSNSDSKLQATDVLATRLRICNGCSRKDCNKGIFGAPPPSDCPYKLEHLVHEQK